MQYYICGWSLSEARECGKYSKQKRVAQIIRESSIDSATLHTIGVGIWLL